jgi:HAD superfamily hydrolase (TIGR01509 family)
VNLVFDLGGVVLRWQPDEFLPRLLPARAPDRAAARALGAAFFQGFGGEWREFDRGAIEPGPLAERIAARIGLEVDEVRTVIEAIPHELQPIPETVALIERMQEAGHRLFFLSNMPLPYAAHLESTHAVLGRFERGVFSSRVGLLKPDAGMFEHAAAHFGLAPQGLVMIDDLEANVAAARRAGWGGVLFEDAARCEAELQGQGQGQGQGL